VSSHPIGFVDYVWRNGFTTGIAREAWNAAALSRESIWHVSRKAWRHGFLRRSFPVRNPPLRQPHLMVDDLVSTIRDSDLQHPWEPLSADLSPGKQIHVRGIARALFYELAFERERQVPSIAPLAAQPVVETCLRIPTYTLLANGVSRGLARHAFHHLLPLEISRRVHKANGTPFYQRLARINMDFLRESLLDGVLVHDGVLDRAKLESYLVPDQRFLTVSSVQLLAYLSAEAWLRQWRNAQKNAVAMFGRVSA
jgi:asparagine synthase (glutamine-hydrolysing)